MTKNYPLSKEVLHINYVDAEIIKDGTSYLISDNTITGTSLEVLSFVVGGIQQSKNFIDDIDGRSRLYKGSEDKYRKIRLLIQAKNYDIHDIAHLRDSINELFDGEYHIREKRIMNVTVQYETPGQKTGGLDLGNSRYVNGKQIKVTKVNSVEIEDADNAEFTVELETVGLPYFESIYTTKELNDSGLDAMVEKYGLVDNIDSEQTQYVFTENTFTVYNAGNVTVRPEQMMLDITIGLMSTNDVFRIENVTTGEVFEFRKPVNERNIYLRGMEVTEGTVYNAFRDTNRKFVSLAPGVNQFVVSGGTFSQMTFNFRYLYK